VSVPVIVMLFAVSVPPSTWMTLRWLRFVIANVRVAHGAARVHVPASVPMSVTNATSLSESHVPCASRQILLAHSLSAVQPRHSCEVVSQTGALASMQSALVEHWMQEPPTHSAWAGSVQSELIAQVAEHSESTQNGIAGSVHCAAVT